MHARGSGHNGGEKRNVLIVSVLLSRSIYFALRSETQGGVKVLRMRLQTVLLHVAAASDPVVCDGQVEDQAPALCGLERERGLFIE